jgi:hypothetical protein
MRDRQAWGRGRRTSSPQSMASRSLPLALFHISSNCYGADWSAIARPPPQGQ